MIWIYKYWPRYWSGHKSSLIWQITTPNFSYLQFEFGILTFKYLLKISSRQKSRATEIPGTRFSSRTRKPQMVCPAPLIQRLQAPHPQQQLPPRQLCLRQDRKEKCGQSPSSPRESSLSTSSEWWRPSSGPSAGPSTQHPLTRCQGQFSSHSDRRRCCLPQSLSFNRLQSWKQHWWQSNKLWKFQDKRIFRKWWRKT